MVRHRRARRRLLIHLAAVATAAAGSVAASVAVTGVSGAPAGASAQAPTTAAYFSRQWGLAQVNAPAAWQYGTGGGVRIGIVDTGVDVSHPDLAGKVAAAATCTNTGGNPAGCATAGGAGQDDNGHGTHVAGIAAAAGNGVAGAAPGAALVVAKVLDAKGSGSTDDVAAGIEWVVAHGARVVNLSLGSDPGFLGVNCVVGACNSGTITGAVEAAWRAGAIPVVAAGNNAGDLFGPGGYGNLDAVVVAATGPQGRFAADYSSTPASAKWGVLAPGGDDPNGPTSATCGTFDASEILSSYWSHGSCYATDEGTSMSTPFVSGTLALLLGRGLGQQQAVQTLLATLNTSVGCGAGQGCLGLVNAGAAMTAAAHMGANGPASGAGTSRGSSSATSTGAGPASSASTAPVAQPGAGPAQSAVDRAARALHRGGPRPGGSPSPAAAVLLATLGLGLALAAVVSALRYARRRARTIATPDPSGLNA